MHARFACAQGLILRKKILDSIHHAHAPLLAVFSVLHTPSTHYTGTRSAALRQPAVRSSIFKPTRNGGKSSGKGCLFWRQIQRDSDKRNQRTGQKAPNTERQRRRKPTNRQGKKLRSKDGGRCDQRIKHIEDKINICIGPSNAEKNATQVDIVVPNDTLSNAQLKKKEVRIRSSKRQKFGWEGKHKGRKKGQSKNILHVQAPKVYQNSEQAQEVKETSNPASIDIQFHKEYNTINSFTQLLTGASSDDLKTENFFEL
ncbi:uncharacterized protein [Zea mays]|uniref:uncharacterized protein n=1 Tax=Zea mays TaxID=4577 RepID=UPI000C6C4D98|nr:uncharacterized protein LOC103645193 [Zea mays]|eukprot:XP_023156642.1 uncharacterized protein LOC103645193 [Zea mays]